MRTRKNIFILSLGCPKNLVDSEVMTCELKQQFKITDNPKNAEIILINTCSFIKAACEESIDAILEAAELKKNGKCEKLIVAGCLTSRFGKELQKSLPEVDVFIGPQDISNIFHIINKNKKIFLNSNVPYVPNGVTKRSIITPKHRAYLKISDGCSKSCSYCTIPKIRGKAKSRPIKDIVNEAEALFSKGVKEITLIAQDTSAYGKNLSNTNILDLLNKLKPLVSNENWIRILYSQPTPLLFKMAEFISTNKGFAPYIDVPIQHVSKKILKLMNRPLNTKNIIQKLREDYNIFLRTTVMCGFPGETKNEFNELLDFIREIKFDHLGAFAFSPEEGTRAFTLKNKPQKKTAQNRVDQVMNLQNEISRNRIKSLIGKDVQILTESQKDGHTLARHIGQAPEIDGITRIHKNLNLGEFYTVTLNKADGSYDLTATL